MSSIVENELEINAIKQDLQKRITFQEMTNAQKKEVINQLFPQGVAFWYADPKAGAGDKVFGWGDAAINDGGFFFGQVINSPVQGPSDINLKLEF